MIEFISKDAKYCRKCFVTQSRRVHDAWPQSPYSFTPIQTLKLLVKMRTLDAGTPGLIPKRNRLKFLTSHFPFCLFIRKKKKTKQKTLKFKG